MFFTIDESSHEISVTREVRLMTFKFFHDLLNLREQDLVFLPYSFIYINIPTIIVITLPIQPYPMIQNVVSFNRFTGHSTTSCVFSTVSTNPNWSPPWPMFWNTLLTSFKKIDFEDNRPFPTAQNIPPPYKLSPLGIWVRVRPEHHSANHHSGAVWSTPQNWG